MFNIIGMLQNLTAKRCPFYWDSLYCAVHQTFIRLATGLATTCQLTFKWYQSKILHQYYWLNIKSSLLSRRQVFNNRKKLLLRSFQQTYDIGQANTIIYIEGVWLIFSTTYSLLDKISRGLYWYCGTVCYDCCHIILPLKIK